MLSKTRAYSEYRFRTSESQEKLERYAPGASFGVPIQSIVSESLVTVEMELPQEHDFSLELTHGGNYEGFEAESHLSGALGPTSTPALF